MLSTLRKTLTVLFVLVGATVVMAACGGDDDAAAPAAKEAPAAKAPAAKAPDPTATSVPPTNTPVPATATPEPATGQKPAKWGGKLILAAHGPPSHFDFYASGTIANLGSQAGMYNQLIRRDPTDHTVPIIGDLAKEWEVSSDALKYTFHLEEGVKFHDGAEMTSEDVVASYTRIVFPDETYGEGLGSARLATYEGIKEINAVDDYTVEFVMKGARNPSMIMQVFSLQWALISRAATLEKHEGNLREVDNHPGTGPYMYTERTDDHWVQDHNPDYWNMGNGPNGCPCIEQIEHIWLVAWTPELAAAMLGGVVDWAQWLDPKTGRAIGDNEGLNGIIQSIPVVSGVGWNIAKEPYSDKRVRKAMALVIDGEAIIQATLDLKGYNFGEWFINGTPYAMDPVELRQTPGFRVPTAEDIAEAQQLIADAGFPGGEGFPVVDMLTRDTNPSRVTAAAVQSMIKEHLGIDGEIRIADVSGIAEEAQAGKFDYINSGYGIILSDPSAYIGQGMKCGNQIGYCNETVDKLIVQLAEEADTDKRIAIVDEMRDIFLDEWPIMPYTAGESVFWGYWDHLKGLIDGSFTASYEMYRWDNVWLER